MAVRRASRGNVTAPVPPDQANGFSPQPQPESLRSHPDLEFERGFRPSIRDEISAALELVRGTHKAEVVAWRFGWAPATFYRRCEEPLSMTVAEFLRLLELCPDPRFNARIRGQLAALDARQAIAEAEAGESYVRVRGVAQAVQRPLFGGDR